MFPTTADETPWRKQAGGQKSTSDVKGASSQSPPGAAGETSSAPSSSASSPETGTQSNVQTSYRVAPIVDPFELLRDMCMPKEYVNFLSSFLESFHYQVKEDADEREYHRWTLVTDGRVYRILLNVHKDLISSGVRLNRVALGDALNIISSKYSKYGQDAIYIIFYGVEPDALYDVLTGSLKREKNLFIKLVSFAKIRDMELKEAPGDQIDILNTIFEIEASLEETVPPVRAPEKPPVSEITRGEIKKLENIIADLDDIERRVEEAELKGIVDVNYRETPSTVAFKVLNQILDYGVVTDKVTKKKFYAIQRFLKIISEIETLPRRKYQDIQDILDKYDFEAGL